MAKGQKTGGRKPGSANKITKDVREAIANAFETVGGADYLVRIAKTSPNTFCALLGKIVPAEVQAKLQGNVTVTVETGVRRPDPD